MHLSAQSIDRSRCSLVQVDIICMQTADAARSQSIIRDMVVLIYAEGNPDLLAFSRSNLFMAWQL